MVERLRKAHRLTRDELAAKLHIAGWEITSEIVKQIEHGLREVNDIELRKLAKVLRVPAGLLLE